MAEVLVVGSGGREQAIAQAMASSSEVDRVIVESNPQKGLEAFSGSAEKPFVIIGPEAPLVTGLASELRDEGYTVFGASKSAAQYEASKSRAVSMMSRARIDHPYTYVSTVLEADLAYLEDHEPTSYVIKADGLAGGKGVVLPNSYAEAREAVLGMRDGTLFDGAGKEIINFQDRHTGPEVTAMAVVGFHDQFVVLPLSQDHKRLGEGDTGPNTGGMGAYAPLPRTIVSLEQYAKTEEITERSLWAMRQDRTPFHQGLLYEGLMLARQNSNNPEIIEYNVRFGDPETQAVLAVLQRAGVDVYRLLRSAAEGSLEKPSIDFSKLAVSALTVCLAAKGYPDSPRKGDVITGLDRDYQDVSVQLAAVKKNEEGQIVTDGGRVAYVTGVGENIDLAAGSAYAAIGEDGIDFAGKQYRKDIGWQARTVT